MRELCLLTDIPNHNARGFPYRDRTMLVYRRGMQVYGYVNRCPHAGVELNWQENKFMSLDGQRLQCSTHGAQFVPESGLCIAGPCQGMSLQPVNVTVENGRVFLDE